MRVNGAIRDFKFVPRQAPYDNGMLVVADANLANAIRKHPYFGKVITEVGEPTEEHVEVKHEYAAVYPDVTKTQEAKDILLNVYHQDIEGIRSKAAALKAAEELNISFPNL